MILFILYIVLLWLFSSLLGASDGILWGRQASDSFKWNEHIVLASHRALVLVLIILAKFLPVPDLFIALTAGFLSFSFFHNGIYYITRHYIDVEYYKFSSDSRQSSALFEVPFRLRYLLFVLSLLLITLYIVYGK
jgi:hypothetical protein